MSLHLLGVSILQLLHPHWLQVWEERVMSWYISQKNSEKGGNCGRKGAPGKGLQNLHMKSVQILDWLNYLYSGEIPGRLVKKQQLEFERTKQRFQLSPTTEIRVWSLSPANFTWPPDVLGLQDTGYHSSCLAAFWNTHAPPNHAPAPGKGCCWSSLVFKLPNVSKLKVNVCSTFWVVWCIRGATSDMH